MTCEKFEEKKGWRERFKMPKMFSYDIDKDYLSKLEDEYLLKNEYESFISKLKQLESVKFKFLFLFFSIVIAVVAFHYGKVIETGSAGYLDLMFWELFGIVVCSSLLIAFVIQRYTILQDAKECVMKKIAQKDLK